MWCYRHAGISYRENSERIDLTRASFASLPGELRNIIYASSLKLRNPVFVKYDATKKKFTMPGVKRVSGRTPLEALELLSNLDHNIRCEVRSYFFANNVFQIETTQSFTKDPDYMETYIRFLEDIGEVGRRSLRWLRLIVSGDSKQHCPTADIAIKFWELIGDCANLSTLDVEAETDYFYMDQQTALKSYMSTEGLPVSNPWPEVLASMKELKNLKRLILRPVFSSRWRYVNVQVNKKASAPPIHVACTAQDVVWVQFQIRRPVDVAGRLSLQLQGYMRRGLRGSMSVRVMITERWDHYGADVTVGRPTARSQKWSLRRLTRCKPHERTFLYSNGFREA
jgi:hypothetical protein